MEGIIIKGVGGLYQVRDFKTGEITPCRARGKFRLTQSPLPGDHVEYLQAVPEGSIEKIRKRSNELIRPAIANVSQAFLVFALVEPDLNWNLLNLFLVVMEQQEIRPLILFNKEDLAGSGQMEAAEAMLAGTGYHYYFMDALKGEIPKEAFDRLKGEVTVMSGPSGAGKSTLLNRLLGEEHMETGAVSEKIGRGRHTTRHTELVIINEGLLADTPGFSNVEPKGLDFRTLKDLFPEFRAYEGQCRFNGCHHDKEPGCAVKAELGNTISEGRYSYYQDLMTRLKEEDKRKWD